MNQKILLWGFVKIGLILLKAKRYKASSKVMTNKQHFIKLINKIGKYEFYFELLSFFSTFTNNIKLL